MAYQLVYRSEAPKASNVEIKEILDSSKPANEKLGITGCLIFRNGFFLQILEGQKETVQDLFYNIQDDNRHHQVEILYEGECDRRNFTGWTVAFLDLKGKNDNSGELNRSGFDRHLDAESPDTFGFRVFWYNVGQLLSEQGFYISALERQGEQ